MRRAAGTCNVDRCANPPVYRGRCHEHAQWNAPDNPRQRGRAHMERRRRLIRAAFGRCVRCGGPPPLELHHLDGNPGNDDPANFEPLCHDCHLQATREQARARLDLGLD